MSKEMRTSDPHRDQPVYGGDMTLERAKAAMIVIHGRGAGAHDILSLVDELNVDGVAYLAPQAAGSTWYPNRFLEPISSNEPWLSSALRKIDTLCASVVAAGIPPERTMLLGFSQGACLALDYAARNARRYGGVFVLSGGLIGSRVDVSTYHGSFEGTPIFLGCGDVDFHIPKERVVESAETVQVMGATVTLRFYRGMGHTVNQEEIGIVRDIVQSVVDLGGISQAASSS